MWPSHLAWLGSCLSEGLSNRKCLLLIAIDPPTLKLQTQILQVHLAWLGSCLSEGLSNRKCLLLIAIDPPTLKLQTQILQVLLQSVNFFSKFKGHYISIGNIGIWALFCHIGYRQFISISARISQDKVILWYDKMLAYRQIPISAYRQNTNIGTSFFKIHCLWSTGSIDLIFACCPSG